MIGKAKSLIMLTKKFNNGNSIGESVEEIK